MSSSRNLRRVAAGAVLALLVVAGVSGRSASAQSGGVQIKLAVPAYFTDKALWDKVLNAPAVTYVIAHPVPPEVGKPYPPDPELVANIAAARAKGKIVLLYVTGGYDKLPWQTVADRIGLLFGAYPAADGAFIDEITYNQCDKYKLLASGQGADKGVKVRFPNKLVILNPGAPLLNCYEGTADGYLTLERAQADIPAWTQNVNLPGNVPYYYWMFKPSIRPQIWQMIHSVKTADIAAQVDAALARNASVLYLTDDVMPNPYDGLPSDAAWNALLAKVTDYNSGKAALPTPSTLKGTPVSTLKATVTTKKTVIVKKKVVSKKTAKKP